MDRHTQLKARQREEREAYPVDMGLRVHRALSWLGRAEAERARGDDDGAFIFYWIAFNAAYAGEIGDGAEEPPSTRQEFRQFFTSLLIADTKSAIYDAIWTRFSNSIRVLLNNPYVFAPFWKAHWTGDSEGWKRAFRKNVDMAHKTLAQQDTQRLLEVIFDRLYVLRNQMMHGGATWNSSVNRDQLRDGVAILGWLIPLFIELMMDAPNLDWKRPFYPVVEI